MSYLYFIIIVLVLAAIAGAGYWYFRRWRQGQWMDDAIKSELLAAWTYTPAEWQQAVNDEFSWGRAGESAELFIYPSLIYIKSGSKKHFFELERDKRVVTFAGYAGIEGSPLKIRVRWKIVTTNREGLEETRYYKEDYRIPVPFREKDTALKVVEFFQTRLENNLNAYTAVLPDDQPISLFGKDGF